MSLYAYTLVGPIFTFGSGGVVLVWFGLGRAGSGQVRHCGLVESART